MIISASRRTDIPAFYSEWFMNRIRAGYCTVPNPFNRKQVSRVSLKPDDVEVIVFWTRNPRPMFRHLEELDRLGYRYYFLFTVLDNPRYTDPHSPRLKNSLRNFRELARRIGPEKIVWRYDPILLTRMSNNAEWQNDPLMSYQITDTGFHLKTFRYIARKLKDQTYRCVFSFADIYAKAGKRLKTLTEKGLEIVHPEDLPKERFEAFVCNLAGTARENGMKIFSCAEKRDLSRYNIRPGKCIDDEYIRGTFGIDAENSKKDPGQRKACGCIVSRDIGMYDSCLFGCIYCYATRSFRRARVNRKNCFPDPMRQSLIPGFFGT